MLGLKRQGFPPKRMLPHNRKEVLPMKKLLSLALAALLPLSLAACGDGPAPSSAGSSGGGPSSTGSAQTEEFTPVTTEAEVRALYEGDEDGTILSVEEY